MQYPVQSIISASQQRSAGIGISRCQSGRFLFRISRKAFQAKIPKNAANAISPGKPLSHSVWMNVECRW